MPRTPCACACLLDKEKQYELWYLDHYHFADMQKNYEHRPLILTRNHFKTPHRYPVLYGGSVNEENVLLLKQIKGLDGFLLGGISLDLKALQTLCDRL